MDKLYIRIQRLEFGLGDIIGSTVAIRACRERYGPDAWITFLLPERVLHLYFDQAEVLGCNDILAPDPKEFGVRLERFPSPAPDGKWAHIYDLSGPEILAAQKSHYDLKESRVLVWCRHCDHVPSSLTPRWQPRAAERRFFYHSQLRPYGLAPGNFVIINWHSAMSSKNYSHTARLIELMRDAGHKIVVVHATKEVPSFTLPAKYDSDGNVLQGEVSVWEAGNLTSLRHLALFTESAKLVIGPDSALTHLAPATDTPHLGLFGPTGGEVITKHYQYSEFLQFDGVQGKACEVTFPCWTVGLRNHWCADRPKVSPWCLEQIRPEQVLARAEAMLQKYEKYNEEKFLRLSSDDPNTSSTINKHRFTKSKTLSVAVPSGIGDSLWALTKVQTLRDEAGAEEIVVGVCDGIPRRSVEFLKKFSFVKSAFYDKFSVHPQYIHNVSADGTYVYTKSHREFEGYSWLLTPNGPLEKGIRLEKWLPEYEIDWRVGIDHFKFSEKDIKEANVVAATIADPYVVFFMGAMPNNGPDGDGHNRGSLWSPQDWIKLGRLVYENTGCHICVVGAPYDYDYFCYVERLNGGPLPNYWHCEIGKTEIGVTFDLCRRSKGVCSFQSGIGIFSVFLGIPTTMFWRPHGNSISRSLYLTFSEKMASAWAPPWSLESGQYLPQIYLRCTPESIFDEMQNAGWFSPSPPHLYAKNSSHPLRIEKEKKSKLRKRKLNS